MTNRPADKTDRTGNPASASRRVLSAVELTRAGMWWEELTRAFWPLLVVAAAIIALLAFAPVEALSRNGVIAALLVAGLALGLALGNGLRRFRSPSPRSAWRRVDDSLPGRPLSALEDSVALGHDDPGSAGLWRAHLARMAAEAEKARPVAPDAELRRHDPLALRLAGMTALAMVVVFAPDGRIGQGVSAMASTFRQPVRPTETVAGGPGWEGWAEPPAYTRRPTIYLNALPEGETLTLPKGSKVSFRLYGDDAQVTQDIGPAPDKADPDPKAPEFLAEKDGAIEVSGRTFPITVLPDDLPTVTAGAAPSRRVDGRLVQEFSATDDNGVMSGKAVIALDLPAIDRRYGLAVDPEPRKEVSVDLPLPGVAQRKDVKGRLVTDLSRHPWANLPVVVKLEVKDGIGQTGTSQPMHMVLPGRRFFDPLGAALIEVRRDLLWNRSNAPMDAQVLRAMTWQAGEGVDPKLVDGLKIVYAKLEAGPLADKDRDDLAQKLWEAAVALEDGGLADALAQMKQAQERLSEAIRNGASQEEIQRLMDELRKATDAYTDMLAEQGKEDSSAKFDRSPKDKNQRITGDQIQKMMDEIQRLMNEGRMAEAQQLLDQFNRMMENLQVTEDPDPNGAGKGRPSNRLAETLREQQRLSDEVMRDLQNQFMQGFGQQQGEGQDQQGEGQQGEGQQPGADGQQGGEQGQPGQQGQPGEGGGSGSFAERQRSLREELGRQRGLMQGQGSEAGNRAGQALDDAGRAMEDAEQSLRDGDAVGAMERQAQAIQSMREGMRALGDMAAEQQGRQQDQQGRSGDQRQSEIERREGERQGGGVEDPNGKRALRIPGQPENQTDPLGRSLDGRGRTANSGDPFSEGTVDPSEQARDLLDEIRRRLGQRDRSSDERDYLGRLLDRF